VLFVWITSAPHCTTVEALAEPDPALVEVKVAVLSYVPQLAAVVALCTCTDSEPPPAANVTGPQFRVSVVAGEPEIEQFALSGDSDQSMPLPPGSGSLIVTPVASAAPLFAPLWAPVSLAFVCRPTEGGAPTSPLYLRRASFPGPSHPGPIPSRATCRPGLVPSDGGVCWYGSTTSICLLTLETISPALQGSGAPGPAIPFILGT